MNPAPDLELLAPLRAAVIGNAPIVALLGKFNDEPSVHTRRPVPREAEYEMIVIGPIMKSGEEDGISDYRPVMSVDLTAYGEQTLELRGVDVIAAKLHTLFHRQRTAITVTNYKVTSIWARGPFPAPSDDASKAARRVELIIKLYAKP